VVLKFARLSSAVTQPVHPYRLLAGYYQAATGLVSVKLGSKPHCNSVTSFCLEVFGTEEMGNSKFTMRLVVEATSGKIWLEKGELDELDERLNKRGAREERREEDGTRRGGYCFNSWPATSIKRYAVIRNRSVAVHLSDTFLHKSSPIVLSNSDKKIFLGKKVFLLFLRIFF